jgi:tellurite resistance protein TerC
MSHEFLFIFLFSIAVVILLILDLGIFHRKVHAISIKESLYWCLFWVSLALLFNVVVYFWLGSHAAMNFLAGYLIEESLSIDNLFVFIVIFTYFAVPETYKYKVLFWGIVGAVVMRAMFIFAGIAIIKRLHWMIYVFGIFLIITAIKLITQKDKKVEPERNPIVRFFRKFVPVTPEYEGGKFFVRRAGKTFATPLFIVLVAIETTDIIFALDSIPAVLAITTDPFIVYTSNIFAILGLRSIFFALSGLMQLFHYLGHGVAAILGFVGIKMLISEYYQMPIGIALGFIVVILTVSIICSVLFHKPVKV